MNTELNVWLVRGRRIIDSRTVHPGGAVRVPRLEPHTLEPFDPSSEADDDIVVDFRDREPVLSLPSGVTGQVASDGEPQFIGVGAWSLEGDARGCLSWSDTTLLVQRLAPRPSAPRTHLARSLWRVDCPLTLTLAAVLFVEIAAIVVVHRQPDIALDIDPPSEASAPIFHVIPPNPVVATKTPDHQAHPARRTAGHPPARSPGPTAADRIHDLTALFARSPVFQPNAGPDLADAFRNVRPHDQIADVRDWHRGATGPGGPVPLDPPTDNPDPYRPTLVDHPRPHPPIIVIDPPVDPPPDSDPDDVRRIAKAIRARTPAIQYCYESGLKLNAGLRGRMTIEFAVSQGGEVTEVGFPDGRLSDDNVVQCIDRTARHWRLPPLRTHKELRVAFPFVFSAGS